MSNPGCINVCSCPPKKINIHIQTGREVWPNPSWLTPFQRWLYSNLPPRSLENWWLISHYQTLMVGRGSSDSYDFHCWSLEQEKIHRSKQLSLRKVPCRCVHVCGGWKHCLAFSHATGEVTGGLNGGPKWKPLGFFGGGEKKSWLFNQPPNVPPPQK